MLVNSWYVSRGMGVRKVSNRKNDLQGHTRVLSNWWHRYAIYDFLLVFHCKYVSILHRKRDVINNFPKFEDVTWHITHPAYSCVSISRQNLKCLALPFPKTWLRQKIKNGARDPDYLFMGVLSSLSWDMIHSTCERNIAALEISLGAAKFKINHVTALLVSRWHWQRFLRVICPPYAGTSYSLPVYKIWSL